MLHPPVIAMCRDGFRLIVIKIRDVSAVMNSDILLANAAGIGVIIIVDSQIIYVTAIEEDGVLAVTIIPTGAIPQTMIALGA